MNLLKKLDNLFFIGGRTLLGLYFIGPGLSKVFGFTATLALMQMKGVPFSSVLLPLTIFIQLIGGYFFNSRKKFKACFIHTVWFNYMYKYLYP